MSRDRSGAEANRNSERAWFRFDAITSILDLAISDVKPTQNELNPASGGGGVNAWD
jgi:hypothetical protein